MATKQQTSDKMWQRKSTHIRFNDEDMDFYFLVPLAFGAERGSTIGECFYIASQIKEGDPGSWAKAWTAYADRLKTEAETAEERGSRISAGEFYLRAFTYYRTGSLSQRPAQPETYEDYENMRSCFRRGMQLLDMQVEPVEIPYNDMILPGYLIHGNGEGPRPTIITTHGGEMFSEELYFWVGAAGMRRGYNVLSIDAPGSATVRFKYPNVDVFPFYKDNTPILVDYALSRPEADPERLAVMGFSGGAYIGMRLTSQDERVKALIATAPIYDLYKLASAEFPPALQKAPALVGDMLLKVTMSANVSTKVAMERILWAAGVKKISELMDRMRAAGPVDPASITCPMLCVTGQGESEAQNEQAHYVYKHLPHPRKAFHLFTVEEGADAHCQNNNLTRLQQVAFNWLDDVFGVR